MFSLTVGLVIFLNRNKAYEEGTCLTVIAGGVRKEINSGGFSYIEISSQTLMGYNIKDVKISILKNEKRVNKMSWSKEKYMSIRTLEDSYSPVECPIKNKQFTLIYL